MTSFWLFSFLFFHKFRKKKKKKKPSCSLFSSFPNILQLVDKSNKALEQQSPSWPVVLDSFPLQQFRGLVSSNLVLKSDAGTLTSSKVVVFPQTSLSLASTLFCKAGSLTIFCAFAAASSLVQAAPDSKLGISVSYHRVLCSLFWF